MEMISVPLNYLGQALSVRGPSVGSFADQEIIIFWATMLLNIARLKESYAAYDEEFRAFKAPLRIPEIGA